MSFAAKTTPKDFKLNPVVRVYDTNGNTLATLNDNIYGVIYDKPWLMKQVAGEETNDQLVYGGVSSNTDPKSLSTDKTSDVILISIYISLQERIAQLLLQILCQHIRMKRVIL